MAAIMEDSLDFVLYGGAIRGGKTIGLLGTFILIAKFFPGSKNVIMRESIEILKSTTLPSFKSIVPESLTWKYPTQSNGWEWWAKNGSIIKFFGENISDDPDLFRFRGLEYDSIGLEEMDITKDTFEKCFQRAGTWKMKERKAAKARGERVPPSKVIGTTNPQDGWVKEDIYDPWRNGTLKKNWLYIPSTFRDNPHLDQKWIDSQKENLSPEDYLKFMDGDWDVNKNRVKFLHHYDDNKHYSKHSYHFDPNASTWLCFDFNYNPTTCTIYQIYDDGVLCIREIGAEGGTLVLCQKIKAECDVMEVPTWLWTVTGDTNGTSRSSTAGDLTDYQIIQEQFGLSDDQIVNVNSRNKAHAYSRRLCDHFLYRAPFIIDNSCIELRKDLLKAKPDGQGKLYKNRDKGFAMDYLDGFRYFVDAFFPGGTDDINSFKNLCDAQKNIQ